MINKAWDHYLVPVYLAIFFVASLVVCLNRWWQMEHFYFNHGLYDSVLWQVAHGQSPLIDHFEFELEHQLGDHFTPTINLLALFFLVTDSYLVLPVLKAVLITGAALGGWLLSLRLVRSPVMRVVLLLSFTWFIGLQNALIGDFAIEMLAIVTLVGAVYALETKNWLWFWSLFLLTLGIKETMAAVVIGLGCYLLWEREYRQGVLAILVSLLYFFVVIKLIIPWFGMGYIYFDRTDPLTMATAVTRFVTPFIKIKTVSLSGAYFAWLPLLSPATLPLLAQDFYVRFVFGEEPNWDLGMYYSTMTAMIMFIGSIKTVQWLERRQWYAKVELGHAGLVLFLLVILTYWQRPPLLMAINGDFYRHTANTAFLRDFLQAAKHRIPVGSKVMVQNNLAPGLTHEYLPVLLRTDYWAYQPDVIVLDLREGQNPNNFWPADMGKLRQALEQDPNYMSEYITDEQVLYWRVERVLASQ